MDRYEELEWRELVEEYETKWKETLQELIKTKEALLLARAENAELKERLDKGL